MKAAVLPLLSVCVLAWCPVSQAVPPGSEVSQVTSHRYASPAATSRSVMSQASSGARPQSQTHRVGLPPINTRFEPQQRQVQQPAPRTSEQIIRPWEVPDTTQQQTGMNRYEAADSTIVPVQSQESLGESANSRVAQPTAATESTSPGVAPALLPEQTSTSIRIHASQRGATSSSSRLVPSPVKGAEISPAGSAVPRETNLSYENTLRQHSPLPASKLAAPELSARPLPRERHELVGGSSQYQERDNFTYTVQGTTAYDHAEPARERTYRTQPEQSVTPKSPAAAPRTSSPASSSRKPRTTNPAVSALPLRMSNNDRRTAPGRWFRSNPLRDPYAVDPDSAFAEGNRQAESFIQQTAAETTSYNQPGTGQAEPIPSLSDEPLQLPFGEEEKKPAAETTNQPAKEDSGLELNLDDFPFNDDGSTKKKSSPTEKTELPDSPFPAETPAEKKPAEKNPSVDDFPFDLPAQTTPEKKPTPPAKETPAESPVQTPFDTPTQTQPKQTEEPMEAAPAEESPLDSPAPEVTPAEKVELKPITAISASIQPPAGEMPQNRSEGITSENSIYYGFGHANRGWTVSSYHWEATAMCHQPLYFEEVNLERYGYNRGALQPAVSYGQFLVNVIAMPYKVIAEPSREAVYTLGHYRPGSYAPYRVQYPPASAAGGMFEAGVVLGLVFLIP